MQLEMDIDIDIKGMIKSSFLDWDGKVVTTIYLPRCNFRCPFCHNWELIERPNDFDTISIAALDRHLRENRDFLDGVVITGGEPTVYPDLPILIDHIIDLGLKVKLDTNGTNPEMLKELIENEKLDYVAMDVKAPLNERYDELTGVKTNLNDIKKSINTLMISNIDYEFRTTVVPSLLAEDDLTQLASDINGAKKFALQQFVPDHARSEKLKMVKLFDKEKMLEIQNIFEENIDFVITRGLK